MFHLLHVTDHADHACSSPYGAGVRRVPLPPPPHDRPERSTFLLTNDWFTWGKTKWITNSFQFLFTNCVLNLNHNTSKSIKKGIWLACVASVSSQGSSRKMGQERNKNEWRGRGRGKKEPLARKPHDFEKLRSPTNAASDWRGAGSVDYLAFETSIKPGMLCFRASQIWSHLICGRRLQMLYPGCQRLF